MYSRSNIKCSFTPTAIARIASHTEIVNIKVAKVIIAFRRDFAEKADLSIIRHLHQAFHIRDRIVHSLITALHAVNTFIRIVGRDAPWISGIELPRKHGKIAPLKVLNIVNSRSPMHFHISAIWIVSIGIIIGMNLHHNRHLFEDNLVLHAQNRSRITRGSIRFIIGVIAVYTDSLARSFKNATTHVRRTSIGTCVIVSHKDNIGSAVVNKWGAKIDRRPSIGSHGNSSAKHHVGIRHNLPVGLARENILRRTLQIKVISTGFLGSTIIEGHAGDVSCAA